MEICLFTSTMFASTVNFEDLSVTLIALILIAAAPAMLEIS